MRLRHVFARIRLKTPADGGRTQALPRGGFGCPVFFEGIPELSEHGYDCRFVPSEVTHSMNPGQVAEEVAIQFLSWEEVRPHLKPGVRFTLWEGRSIGEGEITRIDD